MVFDTLENTNRITIPVEKPAKNPIQEKLMGLKSSGFYNQAEGEWYDKKYPPDVPTKQSNAVDQLLETLVISLRNPKEAKNKLDDLKNSGYFVPNEQEWFYHKNSQRYVFDPTSKILEILIHRQITGQWLYDFDKYKELFHFSGPLISEIHAIVKNGYEDGQAKKYFESLPPSFQSLKFLEKGSSEERLEYHTDELLASVLVVAQYDKQKARQRYEKIKNSKLYDKNIGFFDLKFVSESGLTIDTSEWLLTKNQLLGIWCEHILNDSFQGSSAVPLPAKRTF